LLAELTAALIAFGPWGVFLLALVDSAGLPIVAGADVLILLVGVKAPDRAYFTAFMALAGSLGGNLVLFLAARRGGRRFLRTQLDSTQPHPFQRWFHRYGLATVFVPALVPLAPLPLKIFVISAGALFTPIGRFTSVIVAARSVRYFGEAYLGLRLRSHAQAFLTRNAWTLTGGAFALVIALYVLIHWMNKRSSQPGTGHRTGSLAGDSTDERTRTSYSSEPMGISSPGVE
jgi:membrane protein YqaA with SNARE-associated domain